MIVVPEPHRLAFPMHDHSHAHSHDHDDHHHGHDHDQAGDHVFGQDKRMAGESRTAIVVGVTVVMMVVEIAAGVIYGSMALLADGLHMASHAVALGVTLVAYRMARAWAADRRFSFGVGKINALSGFSSALMLAGFAAVMAIESVIRFANPVAIQFDQALIVAGIGLVVNGASALLLGHSHDHGEGHDHAHPHHHDHNLRAAYLHVLADAMTSVLAIAALLAGKFMGWNWLDPVMGIVGAVLVANWSWGLMRQTGVILLDRQAPRALMEDVREAVEGHADHHHDHDHDHEEHDHDGHDHHHPHEEGPDRVTDLHLWTIGPGIRAAEIVIESSSPLTPEQYRARIPRSAGVVHAVIEVNRKA